MESSDAVMTAILKRDRVVVLIAIGLLATLAWAYVLWLAMRMNATQEMSAMDIGTMIGPGVAQWTTGQFLFALAMWTVMMVGMMTPSVAPMILIYAQVARRADATRQPFSSSIWFAGGYLFVWVLFAAGATSAQYELERAALLSPILASKSAIFGAVTLLAAGIYQWLPLKGACLSQCRAPLSFVQRHGGFQPSGFASLRLGALHGVFCLGCCWALMILLFAFGIMNVLWIAGLTIFVLLEKTVPAGRLFSRAAGAVAIVGGVWLFLDTQHLF